MSSNKKIGSGFEKEFCKILSDNGFWVHRIQDNKNGQPFDVIACRNDKVYAFDCKSCVNDIFSFERIEENQKYAMMKFLKANTRSFAGFALKGREEITIISYHTVMLRKMNGMKSIRVKECIGIDEFLRGGIWR